MKWFTERIKKEFSETIPKSIALCLTILGIIIGTIFTAVVGHQYSAVKKDDAISVNATFSSYKKIYNQRRIKEIIILFDDHEQLSINGVCLSDKVISKVESIKMGTVLNLYIHPDSNMILEMIDNGEIIISFDCATDKLSAEASGFTLLGIFMYLCAAFGTIKLIRKEVF